MTEKTIDENIKEAAKEETSAAFAQTARIANALDEHCMPSQFKKQIEDECAKEYEELGLKELKELLDADQVREIIDSAPTIAPKRGEWIDFKNGWKCNACEKWNSEKSNFCPNCGADMRKESE